MLVIAAHACGGPESPSSMTLCGGLEIFKTDISFGLTAWREPGVSNCKARDSRCKLLLSGLLDRKELKNIFPTLVYQLPCPCPPFRSQISRVIKQVPSVARNSLISQLKGLIVGPLVDALDECVGDQPTSAVLSVLGRFTKQLPSAKFIITGRPEPRIRIGFRLPLMEPFTQIFLLHEVDYPASTRTYDYTSRRSLQRYQNEGVTSISSTRGRAARPSRF